MEKLKLKFLTDSGDDLKEFLIEVPYKEGIVITSEFCPTELISGDVDLLAAFRGEPLERFMENCRKQVIAISQIKESDSAIDQHIGALMAVVMDHLSRHKLISWGELLLYIDCFSLLLKGTGFEEKEIREIYPCVTDTIRKLYSRHIVAGKNSTSDG